MRKLTKRVQAGGLWFDVPVNTNYVSIEDTGAVCVSVTKPMIYLYPQDKGWTSNSLYPARIMVDLEGADWRECCWYVGDQVDGEVVERREWMVRGVEAMGEMAGEFLNKSLDATRKEALAYAYCADKVAKLAAKIRAGEVEQ